MQRNEMISAIISHKDNLRDDELKHHGIQGQKWGVRRYENYDGTLTPEGKERYGTGSKKEAGLEMLLPFAPLLAVTAVELSAFGIMSAVDHHQRKLYDKERDIPKEKPSELKTYPPPPETIKDSYKNTNKRYPAFGTTNNCVACTATMELRQRGYDVRARMFQDGVNGEETIKHWFKGAKVDQVKINEKNITEKKSVLNNKYEKACVAQLKKDLGKKYGDNARGFALIRWPGTFMGHSIYFQIENGEAVFYDGQNKGRNPRDVEDMLTTCDLNYIRTARVDNLKMSNNIGEAVISNGKS